MCSVKAGAVAVPVFSKYVQVAVDVPDDGVEVAVAVEVGEAGRAVVPHIDAVERIGGAGARR